jgi:type I restriction enzyme, S subunit
MNADRLLTHYHKIADAPDAISRLRCFVLDLAVRGKLVPQDPKDEPASELLKRITQEKARLVKLGQVRNEKQLPVVEHEHAPVDLPRGWVWSRLGSATVIMQGFAFSSGDFSTNSSAGYPLIKIGDIGANAPETYIKGQPDIAYLVKPGDILLGLSGSIKCSIWNGPEALLNQRIARISPPSADIHPVWLLFAVNSCIDKWKDETSKLTVQNVKAAQLNQAAIPLPPLAEQHRIVAKVDELMALCDRLEAARGSREATRDRLAAASLARLNAPDPETFQADARFALDALPALTARPGQIKQLRQTILNLAVRGKLVPQDASDEPITFTLRKAMARRAALVKAKKVRAKKLDDFDELAADIDLPTSWARERLGNLVDPENTISYGVLVPPFLGT